MVSSKWEWSSRWNSTLSTWKFTEFTVYVVSSLPKWLYTRQACTLEHQCGQRSFWNKTQFLTAKFPKLPLSDVLGADRVVVLWYVLFSYCFDTWEKVQYEGPASWKPSGGVLALLCCGAGVGWFSIRDVITLLTTEMRQDIYTIGERTKMDWDTNGHIWLQKRHRITNPCKSHVQLSKILTATVGNHSDKQESL